MIDDTNPVPIRPPEPPGPPARRKLTAEGRMIVVWTIFAVAFLALTILVLVPSKYGVAP